MLYPYLSQIISIIGSKDIKIRPFRGSESIRDKVDRVSDWVVRCVAPTLRRIGLYYGSFEWLIKHLDLHKCTYDDFCKYRPDLIIIDRSGDPMVDVEQDVL